MIVSKLVCLIVLCAVAALWFYTQFRKAQDHPAYDGSLVIGDVPPLDPSRVYERVNGAWVEAEYQPPIVQPGVIRNPNGTYAKGSAPATPRGAGGKFVSKASAAA